MDARAKTGALLQVRAADAAADDDALRRLTLWATRYTPTASLWNESNGADGLFLDIEGAAHLFGGEEKLIADMAERLDRFGLPARLAVADTPGMAWALSHFHRASLCVLPSGEEARALAGLPVEALRLGTETAGMLRRLGFKSVGTLMDQPRAPFAARFAAALLRRLDQALGRAEEPLIPVVAPPVYHSLTYLLEPVITVDAIVACANRLMRTLTHVLARDDVGARRLRLCLYRLDGGVETVKIGLTAPTRSCNHVARLIDLELERLAALQKFDGNPAFGFEAIGLTVTCAEPMPARQTEFAAAGINDRRDDAPERYAALIDALRQRLGPHRVRRFQPVASHLPERAETLREIDGATFQSPPPAQGTSKAPERQMRPLLLLPQAEPAENVTALLPDGPPRRFCWRGVTYDVAGCEGPERIAGEWWLQPYRPARRRESGNPVTDSRRESGNERHALTRDYYLLEDRCGRRFWLYREGLYGRETTNPVWFVHGLFA